MGYTNDFFNGFIKWGVLLPDLRFFGYTGMEKSTGRDVDLYFLGALIFFKAKNITTSGGAFSDYVDEPTYRCGSVAVAGTMTDKPDDFGSLYGCILFNLYPYGGQSYMIQILIQSTNIWIRGRTNMTGATAIWETWKKVC